MSEKEFVKLCKEILNLKSLDEARERTEIFWTAVKEGLERDKRVVLKDWGIFELKKVSSRKVIIPTVKEVIYTKPKEVMKFSCGKGLKARVNADD